MAKKKRKRKGEPKKEKGHPKPRPQGPWVSNFDYGGPEEGSDVGPGTGLYHGRMDKYKSVADFLKKQRKRKHSKKFRLAQFEAIIRAFRLDQLKAIAETLDEQEN